MKKKIIVTMSLVVLLVFGFLYTQKNVLIADDKDGKKECTSSCTKKTSTENQTDRTNSSASVADEKSGYVEYEFVTDKISCNDCKNSMSGKLLQMNGVKEVSYGETCSVSHMTNVKVLYSPADTTPEVIAASVKEKGLTTSKDSCGDGSKCTGKNKTEKKL